MQYIKSLACLVLLGSSLAQAESYTQKIVLYTNDINEISFSTRDFFDKKHTDSHLYNHGPKNWKLHRISDWWRGTVAVDSSCAPYFSQFTPTPSQSGTLEVYVTKNELDLGKHEIVNCSTKWTPSA